MGRSGAGGACLFVSADAAIYEAKEAGRGRVIAATRPTAVRLVARTETVAGGWGMRLARTATDRRSAERRADASVVGFRHSGDRMRSDFA